MPGRQDAEAAPAAFAHLSHDLLGRVSERAPVYERESRFCAEDYEDLQAAGYLT